MHSNCCESIIKTAKFHHRWQLLQCLTIRHIHPSFGVDIGSCTITQLRWQIQPWRARAGYLHNWRLSRPLVPTSPALAGNNGFSFFQSALFNNLRGSWISATQINLHCMSESSSMVVNKLEYELRCSKILSVSFKSLQNVYFLYSWSGINMRTRRSALNHKHTHDTDVFTVMTRMMIATSRRVRRIMALRMRHKTRKNEWFDVCYFTFMVFKHLKCPKNLWT